MTKRKKQNIWTDKKGRQYLKEPYYIGGKQKIRRIYVINGIPVDDFYRKNATDIDFLRNEEYWMLSSNEEKPDGDIHYDADDDLP